MKKRTLKKILRIAVPLICAAIFIGTFFIKFKKDNGLNGNEWFSMQSEYMDKLTAFCLNMDEVYALYISGDMSEGNFIMEYALLKSEWEVLDASYEKFLEETPIAPGGHSYISKRGEQAVNSLRATIKDLLDSTKKNNTVIGTDKMLYMYLAHNQQAQYHLAEYTVSYLTLVESMYDESDYRNILNKLESQYYNEAESTSEKEEEE